MWFFADNAGKWDQVRYSLPTLPEATAFREYEAQVNNLQQSEKESIEAVSLPL